MVEDLLAVRGIIVSHETVRRWAEKFGCEVIGAAEVVFKAPLPAQSQIDVT